MFKLVKYLIGAGLIAGTTAAVAGELPPAVLENVMATCRVDYQRVCSFVAPGDGRVARCLLDHEQEVSPPCLNAIKIAHTMEVCTPDYQRFCGGLSPFGGQSVECLASRMEALAPECQRAVSASAPYANGHERYSYYRTPGQDAGAPPYGDAYRYGARPGEGDPYAGGGGNPGRPYDDHYADRSYDPYRGQPYGGGQYPDQGYGNQGYPQQGPGYQPGPGYSPPEEQVPLK